MKTFQAPCQPEQYPGVVADCISEARMKLGMSRISLNSKNMIYQNIPVLVVDLFNEKGKLYTLRYNLPPDSPDRTERRISLLLSLLRKQLTITDDAAV